MLYIPIPQQKPALRYFSQIHRIYVNSKYVKPEIVPIALSGSQRCNGTIFTQKDEVVIKPPEYNRLVNARCSTDRRHYPHVIELYGYWQ